MELLEKLKKLPKVELHLHIDGSVKTSTVSELLNLPIEEVEKQMKVDSDVSSLTDYLKKFELPIQVMQTKENIKKVTKELLNDLKKENVIYAELRFAPMFHLNQGLEMEEVVESVLEAMQEVEGIKSNLILCCMRHDIENGNLLNLKTIEVAKKYHKKGVVALDLAGDESRYPTNLFCDLFQTIKELNLPFTIHSGEVNHLSNIQSALSFGATRIGHGIHVYKDANLLKKLKEKNVTLEVCPQSNVDTFQVKEKKNHPLQRLAQEVLVTINTDNRTVSDITLTQEYYDLVTLMDFTIEDFKQMNLNAIECAFLKEEEKHELKEKIGEYYDTTY